MSGSTRVHIGALTLLLNNDDMVNASAALFLFLFPADTHVFVTGKKLWNLMEYIDTELKVDTMYTCYWIIFEYQEKRNRCCSHGVKSQDPQLISIGHEPNEEVVPISHFIVKFLGGIIDSKLSWVDHIKFVTGNFQRTLGILCKIKRVLKLPTLLKSYYIFIHICNIVLKYGALLVKNAWCLFPDYRNVMLAL